MTRRRVAATLLIVPCARVVHEDAPHHASGHRQEMRAVVPRHVFRVDQPQIRFVDERRRLEAVPGTLSRHAAPRDLVELPVDERNQSLEGGLVALSPFQKQSGDLRGVVSNSAILGPFRRVQLFVPFPVVEYRQRPAKRCALLQRRASRRMGENDAWLVATAGSINADVVGADRIAFDSPSQSSASIASSTRST